MKEPRKQVRSGAILVGIAFSIVLLLIAFQQLYEGTQIRELYVAEVHEELVKARFSSAVFTEEDLEPLPVPLQRYLLFTGFVGQEKMSTARFVFSELDYLYGRQKLKLRAEQYSFVRDPARIVYMDSRILGFIPFEERDKYQRGQGYTTAKLAKLFDLFDRTGPELNQSALVTFLAEALLVPSSILQNYISWETLGDNHVQATMIHRGMRVSGVFTIDDQGKFVSFRTTDRYFEEKKGIYNRVPWRLEVLSYQELNGVKVPLRLQYIWERPDGDLVYFDGELSSIKYNVMD